MNAKTKLHPLHPLHPRASLAALAATARLALFFLVPAVLPAFSQTAAPPAAHRFEIGERAFLLDGRPFQIRCGEMHAARVPREYWDHRLAMMRAMGLNTVCAYLFWNMHEPRPGQFTWSGQANVAEFCRLAQQHGLWVILRPGPYACAEWEMGGLPWWLLRDPDMRLRTTHPGYMDAARRYLREVGRVLAPLQVTRGGPILMVQVENEYGSYGSDTAYMRAMRQAVLDAGFEVPLFACNGPKELRNGFIPGLFQVVNFSSDARGAFAALRKIQPKGPLMCGEFYPGWFDTWGEPHHLGNTEKYLAELKHMLETGASFSIYMAHGGSTFGLWSGCDRPFKPDTSSYDYDAPINEAGAATEKFFLTRELMRAHLNPGETIPDPPAPNPVQTFAPVAATQTAPLLKNLLPVTTTAVQPLNFEALNVPRGCVLYRTTIPAGPASTLTARSIADFGFVFLDGQRLGAFDRRLARQAVDIPARDKPATLDILVEAIGRVNFGKEIHDLKGLGGPVTLAPKSGSSSDSVHHTIKLADWQIHPLPLDDAQLAALGWEDIGAGKAKPPDSPAFWHATVTLAATGDTWLDMRDWGKGVVWVNGRCLGRYWNIGPTQTMYVPGPWLRPGKNEIVILDLLGPASANGAAPAIAGVATPILDQLRPELDFSPASRRAPRQSAP